MSLHNRIRYQRLLREAEGYLELGLPQLAIQTLEKIDEPGTFRGIQLYLLGEAFRAQGRFAEAIEALEASADKKPSKIDIYLALGWCYKRTGRLDRAIEALEKALAIDAKQAILHYNLACYWSLNGDKRRTCDYLSEALRLDPDYRDLIAGESDFDPVREDPEFQSLTSVTV
ncbi:MAG: tetratricopeptide repeat protein [Planctomycetaceae bacterium]|nr:tetratricopeptide repeat protein [Planctomycetaceae bacterium]